MLAKHGLHIKIYNTQQQAETKLIDDLAIHTHVLLYSALRDCYCAYCSTAGIHTIINKVTVYFRACDLVPYIVFEVLACAGNCCVSKTVLN